MCNKEAFGDIGKENDDVLSVELLGLEMIQKDRPLLEEEGFEETDAVRLERILDEREVWEVVKGLNGDMAPRPNNLSMAFL